jgi:hypothetical protein
MKILVNNQKIKIVVLASFFGGSGTKLLHGQLDNSEEILSIPAYPLLYFYPHWFEWKKKHQNLNKHKVLNLLLKHHASIFDTRKISSWNGLYALGKKQNKFLQISKKKFSKNFLYFLKDQNINSRNVLIAIHFAYLSCIKKKIQNIKYILYHIHTYEYISKYFARDFKKFGMILCIRNPLDHFWRRLRQNHRVEKIRYDYSDQERLKNYSYLNMLKMSFQDFSFMGKEYKNKKFFITFEKLKLKNEISIRSICNKLKINFKKNFLVPRFGGFEWWGDKIYEGFKKNKLFEKKAFADIEGKKINFFLYEVFIIEKILTKFFKKFKYNNFSNQNSFFNKIMFFPSILLPSKYGLKLFFTRFKASTVYDYIKNCYKEAFYLDIKDYYFNGMYKHKWSYRNIFFLRNNIFKKILFDRKSKKNTVDKVYRLFYFAIKIFLYPIIQIELIALYFLRIFLILKFSIFYKKIF